MVLPSLLYAAQEHYQKALKHISNATGFSTMYAPIDAHLQALSAALATASSAAKSDANLLYMSEQVDSFSKLLSTQISIAQGTFLCTGQPIGCSSLVVPHLSIESEKQKISTYLGVGSDSNAAVPTTLSGLASKMASLEAQKDITAQITMLMKLDEGAAAEKAVDLSQQTNTAIAQLSTTIATIHSTQTQMATLSKEMNTTQAEVVEDLKKWQKAQIIKMILGAVADIAMIFLDPEMFATEAESDVAEGEAIAKDVEKVAKASSEDAKVADQVAKDVGKEAGENMGVLQRSTCLPARCARCTRA